MYTRRQSVPKPRRAQTSKFVAPVGGWISNRALALPEGGPPGAEVLDNFMPFSTGVRLRRGTIRFATLGDGSLDTLSLFSYNTGDVRKLFGATEEAIYDITTVEFAYNVQIVTEDDDLIVTENGDYFGWTSTEDPVMSGFTGGNWIVTQFATTGGIFLVGVNGEDDGFIYDGTTFWPNYAGGLWAIPYDNEVAPFTVGETVTGGTSGATATIWRVDADKLIVRDVEFTPENWTVEYVGGDQAFTVGSTLRGAVSKASARIASITPGVTTWTLPYDGGTGAFVAAEVVTGATSGATATVVSVAGDTTSGTLTVQALDGVFVDNEAISGSGTGDAFVNGKASTPILSGTMSITGLIDSFEAGEPISDGSGGGAFIVAPETFVGGGSFEDGETITDSDGGEADVNGDYYSAVPGVTFPDGLTSADMSYVWTYKNRMWFAQANAPRAYYMAQVDAIGGDAELFPLDGVFTRGGSLMFGQAWSLEGGAQGGLSEQNVFVSSEGEVAVYQGLFPGDASDWAKVGVYRIGKPLGNRGFIRGGGDLAISTSVGLVPLSKAIQLDVTALNMATVSYGIADAWTEATETRTLENWQAELWPEKKMAIIAPPTTQDAPLPVMFVSNTETGAWTRFTGWQANCMEVFEGSLFFGGTEGRVMLGNVGGNDEDQAYTGTVLPLYADMGSPSSLKVATGGRAVVRATTPVSGQVTFMADYNLNLPTAPNAVAVSNIANIWGSGVWGQSVWGGGYADVVSQQWYSLGGTGYACSLAYQVTSASTQPLDVEVVRMEMLYTVADAFT